jgi:hypothetical protein
MKKIILPLALLLILATPAISLAMEGPPMPMRHLYLDSELIVVATVWAVSMTLNQQGEQIVIAELSPDLVVKGTLQDTTVKVAHPAFVVCPAPPRYKAGERVLAFLQRSGDGQYYQTVGSHWGAKNLSHHVLEAYVARLQELHATENSESSVRESKLLDWLVRCAEDPATRWEGAYELSPPECYGPMEQTNFASQLSAGQKKRLAFALYRSAVIDNGEMCLVRLLELGGDPQLAPFVLVYLKGFKDDPSNGTIPRLMTVVAKKARSNEALELAGRYLKHICIADQADTLRAMLSAFVSVIDQSGRITRFSPPHHQLTHPPDSVRALSFEPNRPTKLKLPAKALEVKAPFGIGLAAIFLGLAAASISARFFIGR